MVEGEQSLVGQIIDGRFRVERRIGSGGMGVVWAVRHVESLQAFALKTLHTASSNPALANRLLREARAAAALKTRHVVRIVDVRPSHVHQDRPLPFIVMELLEGLNLEQILDVVRRLSLGEVVWLIRQLVRALSLAHEHDIVHRDIKPSNLFLATDEESGPVVKLCDFGLAKLTGWAALELGEPGKLSTESSAALGTPRYMAPEQLVQTDQVSAATDQWAVGLLVFRALVGEEYFQARTGPELILAIVHRPLLAPSRRWPELPPAFDDWFLRSCARDPAARFPDVRTQLIELEAALGFPKTVPVALGAGPLPSVRAPDVASHPPGFSGSKVNTTSEPEPGRLGLGRRYALLGAAGMLTLGTMLAVRFGAGPLVVRAVAINLAWATNEETGSPSATPSVVFTPNHAEPRPRIVPTPSPPLSTLGGPEMTTDTHLRAKPSASARAPAVKTIERGAASSSPRLHLARDLLPHGAACVRSVECHSGLCLAEQCQ